MRLIVPPVALDPQPPEPAPRSEPGWLALLERSAGAGCWSLDSASGELIQSAGLLQLLGLPQKHSLHEADLLSLFAPESQEAMAAAIETCRSQSAAFELQAQALTAQGERLPVSVLGQPVLDAAGQVSGLQGVLRSLSADARDEPQSRRVLMQLSTTLASISQAFATLDHDGRFSYVNPQTEGLLEQGAAALLGRRIWRVLDDNGAGQLRHEINKALATGLSVEFDGFYLPQHRWLELRIYPFADGLALYLRDVTERHQAQEKLQLLQASISRLNDLVVIARAGKEGGTDSLEIVFVNEAFERETGYSQAEVLGRSPYLLQGPQTQHADIERIKQAMRHALPVRAELTSYKKNGETFWLELEIVPVDQFHRGPMHWVAVGRDITARKAADDEIEHLAFYDTLTGLPNRQLLMARLEHALNQPEPGQGLGALMFIDLDHFKVLNDTLGHSRGDLLLQQVAARLQACVRRTDTVARLGGDEFVVMLEALSADPLLAVTKTRAVSHKIMAALSEPYDLGGHQHHGTCSIGITQFGAHSDSLGNVLKQADLAMYQAKAAGRNAACFFDPEMQAAATANAALTSELRQALHEQHFVLHYQPQVGREGRMLGVEALLRWQRPERLVMPDEFVSQAEESGLILPLGAWVLETACAQLAAWAQRPATEGLSVAVNVSVRQFRHPEFVDQVMDVMARHGVRAGRLKLELTESLLASDIDVTIAKMGMLKDAGVTLSIDDFGMGFSALSYLKHLPLDQLKIDRTFVKDVLTDPNDAAIARTIIGLAQSLGLGVMAEGVETLAQREFLTRHGCDNYQGFLFCEALPSQALERFIDKQQLAQAAA